MAIRHRPCQLSLNDRARVDLRSRRRCDVCEEEGDAELRCTEDHDPNVFAMPINSPPGDTGQPIQLRRRCSRRTARES